MDKIPQFIETRDAGARKGGQYIGITKNGSISIYSAFYKNKGIDKFSRCLLLLDKNQGLIGLQFGGDELGKGSYTINHDEKFKTAYIVSTNLFKTNNLDIDQWHGKYIPEKFEGSDRPNVYFIDLDQREVVNRKPNKRKIHD